MVLVSRDHLQDVVGSSSLSRFVFEGSVDSAVVDRDAAERDVAAILHQTITAALTVEQAIENLWLSQRDSGACWFRCIL